MPDHGIPEAESRDQSWMNPRVPPRPPTAPYSDYNPPPDPPPAVDRAALLRSARRSLLVSAVCFAILAYLLLT